MAPILHRLRWRLALGGALLLGLLVGQATIPVRAQSAQIRNNNNAMGLINFIDALRYHNFGTTLGSDGFGIRENAGAMQVKDDAGAWAAIGVGGAGAPTNATYITQTPNATLTNEQALDALASGIMRVDTVAGVITSLVDSAGIAANISDETGSGLLVFGTDPTFSNDITVGGQIFIADGSAGDPAIAFTANPDVGFFVSTANSLSISVNNSEKFRFANNALTLRDANAFLGFRGIGTQLYSDANNQLDLRNGTNAQRINILETFTNSTNNQGLSIDAGVTAVDRITYTGFQNGSEVDPIDLVFNPVGTGNVGFGTVPPVRYHDVAGVINAPSISASESYKSGLGVSIGTDTAHDIDAAAGVAQSFDTTEDIIFAAQAGKQLDVKWATGAAAGMLGDPDRTAAIVLTFLEDGGGAGVDTATAGSGTPWADCNALAIETGTVIFQGGSTNNGTFEITSCTDTVLTLGDVLTNETGGSGEYESRLVLPTTWYHVWLIELAGAEDICADVSETAVDCLSESGYDEYRLLQSILTDDTANIRSF